MAVATTGVGIVDFKSLDQIQPFRSRIQSSSAVKVTLAYGLVHLALG